MTTASDLITQAFRDIQLVSEYESPAAATTDTGLGLLNQMLHAWAIDYGVDLAHSDLALADTITLPDSHLRAVRYNLALALASKYGAPLDAETITIAKRGLRALQNTYTAVPELEIDRGVRNRLSSRFGNEKF